MAVLERLKSLSLASLTGLNIVLFLVIGAIDYITGPEISFSIFYLVPVALATWLIGRRAGLLAAGCSAVIWLVADLGAGHVYSAPAIPYWNALVRFGFFTIVSLTLAALRSAQAHREEMAHFLVHDLRSPLANVMTSLQFMQDAGTTDDELQSELVQMSIASGHRMMSLISSLLDLARMESGRMVLRRETLTVLELIEEAAQQLGSMAARGDVNIVREIDDGMVRVVADREITVRVLVNLVSNALKYSPADAAVVIGAAAVDNAVHFHVADQGPGIPKEWTSRVFDKFAQVEARRANIGAGSGLGLSFCRQAVEAQGGKIWIDTTVAKGTTVIFSLPRATGEAGTSAKGGPSGPPSES